LNIIVVLIMMVIPIMHNISQFNGVSLYGLMLILKLAPDKSLHKQEATRIIVG